MKESKLLGALLPSHPELIPIIRDVREKYKLPEISLDTEPIEEIYFGDEIIPLDKFRDEIAERVRANLDFMPPDTLKQYNALKKLPELEKMEGLETLPNQYKELIESFLNLTKKNYTPTLQAYESLIDNVINMLYEYILTGEAGEIPLDWSMQVITTKNNNDDTLIYAIASQLADPEEVISKFRHAYNKAFGVYRPRITNKTVSAMYYVQLSRRGKPWKFIVEEYIRLEVTNMPKNTNSQRYRDMRRICEQTLRKRMQRSEHILDILFVDKK